MFSPPRGCILILPRSRIQTPATRQGPRVGPVVRSRCVLSWIYRLTVHPAADEMRADPLYFSLQGDSSAAATKTWQRAIKHSNASETLNHMWNSSYRQITLWETSHTVSLILISSCFSHPFPFLSLFGPFLLFSFLTLLFNLSYFLSNPTTRLNIGTVHFCKPEIMLELLLFLCLWSV